MVMWGAVLSGVSKSMEDAEKRRTSELERKVRQAQIDKLMQDIAYQQQMQPYEIRDKESSIASREAQTAQLREETKWVSPKAQAAIDRDQAQLAESKMNRDKAQFALDSLKQEQAALMAQGGYSKKIEMEMKKAQKDLDKIDSEISENKAQANAATMHGRASLITAGRRTSTDDDRDMLAQRAKFYQDKGVDASTAQLLALKDITKAKSDREPPPMSLDSFGGGGSSSEKTSPLPPGFVKNATDIDPADDASSIWNWGNPSQEQQNQAAQRKMTAEGKRLLTLAQAGSIPVERVIGDPNALPYVKAALSKEDGDMLDRLLTEKLRAQAELRIEQETKVPNRIELGKQMYRARKAEKSVREIEEKIRNLLVPR